MRDGALAVLLGAVVTTAAVGCERAPGEVIEQRREIMGTSFVFRVWSEPSDEVYTTIAGAFDRAEQIEGLLSDTAPESEISRINKAAGGAQAVQVRPETLRVLEVAAQISDRSGGALDVTWAALRNAWKLSGDGIDPRDDAFRAKVGRLHRHVDYRKVEIDPEAGTVRLAGPGMQIGLGALAKGLALDEAAAVLLEHGFRDFILEAGGEVVVRGRRGNRDWTVGIRHPRRDAPEVFTILPVRDRAVATTGDYERFRMVDGTRYSHVIDPRTGYPARSCVSATVIHPSGVVADALATAVFVLGPADGIDLVKRFPDAEAVIVDPNLHVHVTAGLARIVRVRWLKPEPEE